MGQRALCVGTPSSRLIEPGVSVPHTDIIPCLLVDSLEVWKELFEEVMQQHGIVVKVREILSAQV